MESDSEVAFEARRELTRLLVEKVLVGRDEEGRTKVDVTYRFGPPKTEDHSADGGQNSEAFRRAHGRGGAGGLLTGYPRMSSYSVAVERVPEASGRARRSGQVRRGLGQDFPARFVFALAEDGERKSEQEDQQDDQKPERQTLPHLVSSLDYRPSRILTQSAGPVFEHFSRSALQHVSKIFLVPG